MYSRLRFTNQSGGGLNIIAQITRLVSQLDLFGVIAFLVPVDLNAFPVVLL
jgi:hypothetical protein